MPGVLTLGLAFRAGGYFPHIAGATAVLLCLALVARVTLASRPFAGWSPALAIAAGALGAFTAWTLISAAWSDAPERALIEFTRALLYLLVLVLLGSRARTEASLAVVLRWVGMAVAAVCTVALLTRLLPEALPTGLNIHIERLSFPLTYWNALGVLGAIGAVLCLHLTASQKEPPALRVVAAGALPIIAVTLYFTFSRGGIAAAVLGTVSYAVLSHPRSLATGLTAVAAPTVLAVVAAYDAELLARTDFTEAAAVDQGGDVLVAVGLCVLAAVVLRAALLLVDRRLARIRMGRATNRRFYAVTALTAAFAFAGASVAFDLPDRVAEERESFARAGTPGGADLRSRLTDAGNNGRIDLWRVAREAGAEEPVHGSGAGTYRLTWERTRPAPPARVADAHSLYQEVFAELGVVGLVLLAIALVTPLAVALGRLGGPARHAHAAFLAGAAALLAHAGVDWDWEMPVLFVWFFGAAGALLAATDGPVGRGLPRLVRVLAGLGCLLVALTPFTVARSQVALNDGVAAFKEGECPRAVDRALDSLAVLRVRAEPFEVLGWCDLGAGATRLGLGAMRAAQRRDPENWQYAYGVAVAQGLVGEDPRPMAELAWRLNPHEPLTNDLREAMRGDRPARWRRAAASAPVPVE